MCSVRGEKNVIIITKWGEHSRHCRIMTNITHTHILYKIQYIQIAALFVYYVVRYDIIRIYTLLCVMAGDGDDANVCIAAIPISQFKYVYICILIE